jgi:hypothetical protein
MTTSSRAITVNIMALTIAACGAHVDPGDLGVGAGAAGAATDTPASATAASNAIVGAGGAAGAGPQWVSPETRACPSASKLAIVGTWNGYVENGYAPWDSIRLVITGASESGGVCGTMTVGKAAPPAPATDPNVGYPPGAPARNLSPPYVAGYPLTILNGTAQAGRVRFGVADRHEPWKGWCELQTVLYPNELAVPGSSYGCAPNWASLGATDTDPSCYLVDPTTDKKVPVDCGKLQLCAWYPVCQCDATKCTAARSQDTRCDLQFGADEATGSCTTDAGTTVRLFRVK